MRRIIVRKPYSPIIPSSRFNAGKCSFNGRGSIRRPGFTRSARYFLRDVRGISIFDPRPAQDQLTRSGYARNHRKRREFPERAAPFRRFDLHAGNSGLNRRLRGIDRAAGSIGHSRFNEGSCAGIELTSYLLRPL